MNDYQNQQQNFQQQREEVNFKFDLRDPVSLWPKIFKFIAYFCILLSLPYLAGLFFLPYYGNKLSDKANASLFDESPDLIAVFTGDAGRIEQALEYAVKHPSSKLLISGVYSKNNLITLLNSNNLQSSSTANFDFLSQIIELDYQSQNTLDNVLMTLNFLRKNKNFHKVLIISSDYHLTRIHLLFHSLKNPDDQIYFNFLGVNSNNTDFFKRWKILSVELFKGLQTIGLLLFLE